MNKVHLIGDLTKTLCGKELDEVMYVIQTEQGLTCKACLKIIEGETVEKLNQPEDVKNACQEIIGEYYRSIKIHGELPKDIIHAVAIMAEEAGESIQAAIDFTYSGEPIDKLREELIQTGAMCLKVINLIDSDTFDK